MAESPLSPGAVAAAVSEVGLNVVVDLHSSASAVLNDNSAGSTADIFGPVDLQCPVTPQINLKLSELSSGSGSDDEAAIVTAVSEPGTEGGARSTASPPPNCAICLGRCKNKCFTDSCMHQFCFKCLCEWSKIKPECPLCKQLFKSIIHNVKSIDQFEEYHVLTPSTLPVDSNVVRHFERSVRLPYLVDSHHGDRRWGAVDVSLNHIHRGRLMRTARSNFFPSSSTATDAGVVSTPSIATTLPGNANVQNQFVHRGELLEMYRQEYPDGIASGGSFSGTLSQLWRRYVYDRKLYALPVCDVTGRFRQCTGRFYRDNPAQIHRLMPWINRDIVCLLRNTEHDVTSVLERINEWLTMTDILKPLFRRRLQPILGTKTAHFIHELYNFARSPYDMIGYDRAVQYSPRNTEEVVIEFSLSSSSSGEVHSSEDEEPLNVVDGSGNDVEATTAARSRTRRRRNAQMHSSASRAREYRLQARPTPSNTSTMINLLSFSISTTGEGVEVPGVSSAAVADSASRSGRGAQSIAINLSTHNRSSEVIIDLDDTDVDIEFNATTTPSDAVFAPSATTTTSSAASILALPTPTVTDNIELSSTTSSDECEFVLERKPPHLRTPEMVSLNSESDSDVVFVGEDQNKPESREEYQEETKNDQIPEQAEADFHQADAQIDVGNGEEYNVGASTSTGLRSSGRRRCQKSIDMETNKIRKQERRKRRMRSSKEDSYESTSSGSEWNTEEVDEEEERVLRNRKRSGERKRAIRRTTRRSVRIKRRKRSVEEDVYNGKKGGEMKENRNTENADDDDDDDDELVTNSHLEKRINRIDSDFKELSEEYNKSREGLMKEETFSEVGSIDCASENVQQPNETNEHEGEVAMFEHRMEPSDECEEGSTITANSEVPNLSYNEPIVNGEDSRASPAQDLPEQRSSSASDAKSFSSKDCSSLRSSGSSIYTSTSTSSMSDSSTTSDSSSSSNSSASEDSEDDVNRGQAVALSGEQKEQDATSTNVVNILETDTMDAAATLSSMRDCDQPLASDITQETPLFDDEAANRIANRIDDHDDLDDLDDL